MPTRRLPPSRQPRPRRHGRRERGGRQVDADPDAVAIWPRSATSPSDTSVIAVAPARRRRGLPVWRLGHQVPTAQHIELANTAVPQRISSGRSAQLSGDRHGVAWLRAAAAHRLATAEVAQHRHRNHPLRRADQITADDARPEQPRLIPHPVGELERLRGSRVRGRAECDDERGGLRTHRLDVGGVLRDGLTAHVMRCGPTGRKCRPATSMSVDTTVLPSSATTTAASSPGPNMTVAG